MQFLEFLGCANGGMNMCSHARDSVNVFACDWTGFAGARQIEGLVG